MEVVNSMIPKFVTFTFKKAVDWEITIFQSFPGYSGFCTAIYKDDKTKFLTGSVEVLNDKVIARFPASETQNAILGNYIFDIELNIGDLGNPDSSDFTTITIGKGVITVTE